MPQWIMDLFLNIFSEIFGIALTVFFIDRLIKKREEQRWARSKRLQYARIVSFTNGITLSLALVIPYGSLKRFVYDFADIKADSIEYDIEFDSDEILKNITTRIQPRIKESTAEVKLRVIKGFSRIFDELDNILGNTTQLIEPEFLALLLELRECCVNLRNMEIALELGIDSSVIVMEAFEYNVWKTISVLEKIKILLSTKAVKKYVPPERKIKL